jgi:hypothetical protein
MGQVVGVSEAYLQKLLHETPYSLVCFHNGDRHASALMRVVRESLPPLAFDDLLIEVDVSRLSHRVVQWMDLMGLPVVGFFHFHREVSRLDGDITSGRVLREWERLKRRYPPSLKTPRKLL